LKVSEPLTVVISFSSFYFVFEISLTFLLIDEDAIRDHIVPGLKILLSDAETLDPSYKSLIQSMITDMEAAISDEGGKPSLAKQASVQPSQGSSYSWSFGLGNLGMDKLKNMTTRKN
jgi:hypothetical protein